MRENRNNSRESRRAPLFHSRSLDRPMNSYDKSNLSYGYKTIQNPRRFEDHPLVSPNPLGVAFGYVCIPAFVRRSS